MRIEKEISYDLDDLLLKPQRSTLESRNQVVLEREFYFYHSPKRFYGIPIICSNMTSVGTLSVAKILSQHKIVTCLHKYYSVNTLVAYLNEYGTEFNWISIGKSDEELLKLNEIQNKVNHGINICIDIANGHLDTFVTFCNKVRQLFPESIIMAGNVAIPESTQELIIHGGIDIVKTQIGPSLACKTRIVTGVGVGTASCIIDCSSSAHGLKAKPKHLGLICSDGGCKTIGDISKSFALGSDFIMTGKLFAGTDACSESEWIEENNKKYMLYYGMSTHKAQQKWGVGKKDYRASEGNLVKIPYQGSLEDRIQEILGGIRSCCTYIGADSIKDMSKCAVFLPVNKIHSSLTGNLEINGV